MFISVRSGLEWWASAAIILAYAALTIYYRTDPDGARALHLPAQL